VQKYGPLEIFQQTGPLNPFNPRLNLWCRVELCEVRRYFAAALEALLRIARSVYSNSPGDPEDWGLIANCPSSMGPFPYDPSREPGLSAGWAGLSAEELWAQFATPEMSHPPMTTREARLKLTLQMNMLLALGKIRPYFAWASRNDQPQVLYAGGSLLSYLVLQLCLKMAKIDGHTFCDHCGKLYEPQRLPRADRRNFCRTCQDNGISAQLADRKWREKERRQRHAVH
jgi:hypothetical protein